MSYLWKGCPAASAFSMNGQPLITVIWRCLLLQSERLMTCQILALCVVDVVDVGVAGAFRVQQTQIAVGATTESCDKHKQQNKCPR
jgi:hypothetical protein